MAMSKMDDMQNMMKYGKRCELKNIEVLKNGYYANVFKAKATKSTENVELLFVVKIIRMWDNINTEIDFNELIIMKNIRHKFIAQFIDGGIHFGHDDFGQDIEVPKCGRQRNMGNVLQLKISPRSAWIQMP
ncbi:hypothetical protein B4U80_11870, partial [Leptotrombidium deliense]